MSKPWYWLHYQEDEPEGPDLTYMEGWPSTFYCPGGEPCGFEYDKDEDNAT